MPRQNKDTEQNVQLELCQSTALTITACSVLCHVCSFELTLQLFELVLDASKPKTRVLNTTAKIAKVLFVCLHKLTHQIPLTKLNTD